MRHNKRAPEKWNRWMHVSSLGSRRLHKCSAFAIGQRTRNLLQVSAASRFWALSETSPAWYTARTHMLMHTCCLDNALHKIQTCRLQDPMEHGPLSSWLNSGTYHIFRANTPVETCVMLLTRLSIRQMLMPRKDRTHSIIKACQTANKVLTVRLVHAVSNSGDGQHPMSNIPLETRKASRIFSPS